MKSYTQVTTHFQAFIWLKHIQKHKHSNKNPDRNHQHTVIKRFRNYHFTFTHFPAAFPLLCCQQYPLKSNNLHSYPWKQLQSTNNHDLQCIRDKLTIIYTKRRAAIIGRSQHHFHSFFLSSLQLFFYLLIVIHFIPFTF